VVQLDARPSCELLEWDSEHFGFPIARVSAETLTTESAEAIDEWCIDQGVRCLYFLADAEDVPTAQIAASHGYRAVDLRATVGRSTEGVPRLPSSGPGKIEIREAREGDLNRLRELAAISHRHTRFYLDGSFPPERCDALYEAWVERGFRDPQWWLLVALVEREPVGYMVFSKGGARGEGHGELGAVDERHRGKGISRALHISMLRLLAERGVTSHRCPLSARNLAVIRLHERLGFITEKVEVWHHKWFGR
jgi:GNAT superfamily N-acetyltransferase